MVFKKESTPRMGCSIRNDNLCDHTNTIKNHLRRVFQESTLHIHVARLKHQIYHVIVWMSGTTMAFRRKRSSEYSVTDRNGNKTKFLAGKISQSKENLEKKFNLKESVLTKLNKITVFVYFNYPPPPSNSKHLNPSEKFLKI